MIIYLAIYIALLLTASTALSLYERYMPKSKKGYFTSRLKGVEKEVWDREFLRYKAREIREEVRQEYDKLRAKKEDLVLEIERRKKEVPALTDDERKLLLDKDTKRTEEENKKLNVDDERRRLEDQVATLDRDIKRKLEGDDRPEMQHIPSLKSLDSDIEVTNASLEGLHELKSLIKDYMKRL